MARASISAPPAEARMKNCDTPAHDAMVSNAAAFFDGKSDV
jgi:hypothetical protein